MKNSLSLFLFIILSTIVSAQTVKVMSYNIRYANRSDGKNGWCKRKAKVTSLIKKYDPDIVGTQEALHKQLRYMKRKLEAYNVVGVGRNDGKKKGEYAAIFYNKDTFELQASNTFWLSETPEKPGSWGWDAAAIRIATWCRLKHIRTGKLLLVFNTHFDHVGKIARKNSAILIKEKIKEIAGNEDVILLGDLNTTPTEEAYPIFTSEANGFALMDVGQGNNDATFCGFEVANKNCVRIDYIFCNQSSKPFFYKVIDDHDGSYYPSDHMPILGEILLLHKP
jgi:endonuclease/exonuclease/phosphatase family metal-dependent hydrolase